MKDKKEKKQFIKGIIAGVLLSTLVVVGFKFATGDIFGKNIDKATAIKLQNIDCLIKEKYLYSDKIDQNALKEGMIKGYIQGLGDPYSAYYDKKEFKELTESTEGTFYGIGAQFNTATNEGFLTVINVYEGSPAKKAGIRAGDVLTKVDGKDVGGMSAESVVSRIKGKNGSKVKLTFTRNKKDTYTVDVKREKIEVPTVAYRMQRDNIGYIQITEFTGETATQFNDAFVKLEKQGMVGLVIDLRNNPGGRVDTTGKILDKLLGKGPLVKVKDKNGKEEVLIDSDEKHKWNKPIVVLINGYSASASELFAGAMQDYEVATIIGTKSYGKGVVQQIFSINDGTGVKLTIAEYFTPKGHVVNKKGITPDIKVEETRKTPEDPNDAQLLKGFEVVKGKIR